MTNDEQDIRYRKSESNKHYYQKQKQLELQDPKLVEADKEHKKRNQRNKQIRMASLLKMSSTEIISADEIAKAFVALEAQENQGEFVGIDNAGVLGGKAFDFAELEQVDQGIAPQAALDEVDVIDHDDRNISLLELCHVVESVLPAKLNLK
ncbi:hypothetical protein BDR05DRAFT_947352 [Suillus weaverae]|nr:hypothetical protein BDR05DRAFT_947352 [Suillus weaverae]